MFVRGVNCVGKYSQFFKCYVDAVPFACKSNIVRCLVNNRRNDKGILQVVKCDFNIRIIKFNWLISFICVSKD